MMTDSERLKDMEDNILPNIRAKFESNESQINLIKNLIFAYDYTMEDAYDIIKEIKKILKI